VMQPKCLLVVSLICACSSQRTKQIDLSAPVRMPDGGLAIVFDDGTIAATAERDFEDCHADAGAFLALVSDRHCESDSDCAVFRHGLAAVELRVCYPIRSALRGSDTVARERQFLARQCGFATIYSNEPCERARCVLRQCELSK